MYIREKVRGKVNQTTMVELRYVSDQTLITSKKSSSKQAAGNEEGNWRLLAMIARCVSSWWFAEKMCVHDNLNKYAP